MRIDPHDFSNSIKQIITYFTLSILYFVFGQNKEHNNNNEENSENKGKKESDKCVVFKANIHCDGCSDQISKCLKGFEGN